MIDAQEPVVALQADAGAWSPTRAEGERRIAAFVPRAGRTYAEQRNFDRGPDDRDNVSVLSPYVRHRLVGEDEIVRAVLARHAPSAAEKYVQEVLWRTYWKGRLERAPAIWSDYLGYVVDETSMLANDRDLATRAENAMLGRTGNQAFDSWARELVATGYLHNHARMWFASMWIFTLRLPWTIGADFFMRHLLDGDPASNTLSWRWVAGLQTKGKTYNFSRDNVMRYTEGRLDPGTQIARHAEALDERPYPLQPAPELTTVLDPSGPAVLLVHDDDCSPETFLPPTLAVPAAVGFSAAPLRSPGTVAEAVRDFSSGAVADALARYAERGAAVTHCATHDVAALVAAVTEAARAHDARRVVVPYAPVGPNRPLVAEIERALAASGLAVHVVARAADDAAWRHASSGYFAFRGKMLK